MLISHKPRDRVEQEKVYGIESIEEILDLKSTLSVIVLYKQYIKECKCFDETHYREDNDGSNDPSLGHILAEVCHSDRKYAPCVVVGISVHCADHEEEQTGEDSR